MNGEIKALVTVYEDLPSAVEVIKALRQAGIPTDAIELVTNDIHAESPEVQTPPDRETTTDLVMASAEKWGAAGMGAGAVVGLLASVLTPFPGMAIGAMIVAAGATSAVVGGIGGMGKAVRDDTVNLPTPDEYEELLKSGFRLVVVRGTHEQIMRARDVILKIVPVRSHLHPLHGHEFHEHPSVDPLNKPLSRSSP